MQLQNVVFCFWMGGELSAIPRAKRDSYSGISHQTHNTETAAPHCITATRKLMHVVPIIGILEAKC